MTQQKTRTVVLTAMMPAALALGAMIPLETLGAQQVRVYSSSPREIEIVRGAVAMDRPVLGVTIVDESERADTLGLRVSEVTPESPAAKAGIKSGDRLQGINGVSLRADRADAGQDDYDGVLLRRLQREMAKAKAGDTLRVQVWSDGRAREVRVVTVTADELYRPERTLLRASAASTRPVIGVTTSPTGTARDTLGVFLSAVTEDGPAAKAGIIEGDRIAAINGVSLRVAREDAGDEQVAAAKANRLRSELEKVEPGQSVELTVVSAGRSRTLRVTPVPSSELREPISGSFMWSTTPEAMEQVMGQMRMLTPADVQPPIPPVPPVAPAAPRARPLIRGVRVL
jgi:serine protease Do